MNIEDYLRKHTSDVIKNVVKHYEDEIRDEKTMRLVEHGVSKCIAPWAPYSYNEIGVYAERIGGCSKGAQVTVIYKADGQIPIEVKESYSVSLQPGEPYDPTCYIEDYTFVQRGGPGSLVQTLPEPQDLGELKDLAFFQEQITKATALPSKIIDPDEIFLQAEKLHQNPPYEKMSYKSRYGDWELVSTAVEDTNDTLTYDVLKELQSAMADKMAVDMDKMIMDSIMGTESMKANVGVRIDTTFGGIRDVGYFYCPYVPASMPGFGGGHSGGIGDDAAEQIEFTLDDLDIDWDLIGAALDEDNEIMSRPLFDE